MKFNIDMNEMEQQRYDAIKKSGKYLELDVLIGVEGDNSDGKIWKMPVITTCMHGCRSNEISALYMILGSLREHLEEKYPMECIMADISMSSKHMSTIQTEIEHEED